MSTPTKARRLHKLDRSSRLSIIDAIAARPAFDRSPTATNKPAGMTLARVQSGRAEKIKWLLRYRCRRFKRRQTSHAPDSQRLFFRHRSSLFASRRWSLLPLPKIQIFWARRFLASASVSNPSGLGGKVVSSVMASCPMFALEISSPARGVSVRAWMCNSGRSLVEPFRWRHRKSQMSRWAHFSFSFTVCETAGFGLENALFA